MVIDVFASKYVKVNTPTKLKGHGQLDAETVVRDRRNASKIIHVERITGCAKTFKIIKRQPYIARKRAWVAISWVCFMLTNFRPSIVGIINLPHMNENMFTTLTLAFIIIQMMKPTSNDIIK